MPHFQFILVWNKQCNKYLERPRYENISDLQRGWGWGMGGWGALVKKAKQECFFALSYIVFLARQNILRKTIKHFPFLNRKNISAINKKNSLLLLVCQIYINTKYIRDLKLNRQRVNMLVNYCKPIFTII